MFEKQKKNTTRTKSSHKRCYYYLVLLQFGFCFRWHEAKINFHFKCRNTNEILERTERKKSIFSPFFWIIFLDLAVSSKWRKLCNWINKVCARIFVLSSKHCHLMLIWKRSHIRQQFVCTFCVLSVRPPHTQCHISFWIFGTQQISYRKERWSKRIEGEEYVSNWIFLSNIYVPHHLFNIRKGAPNCCNCNFRMESNFFPDEKEIKCFDYIRNMQIANWKTRFKLMNRRIHELDTCEGAFVGKSDQNRRKIDSEPLS